jgi:hypothetical protein
MKRNEKEHDDEAGDEATVTFFATKICPELIEASQIVGKYSSLPSVAVNKRRI